MYNLASDYYATKINYLALHESGKKSLLCEINSREPGAMKKCIVAYIYKSRGRGSLKILAL